MRRITCTIGGALLVVAFLALSAVPTASAVTTNILPGTIYEETVSADDGDSITYSWDTDGDVRFIVRGPGSNVLLNVIDDSRFDIFDVPQAGTYRFSWENLEATTVTLDYDVNVLPFSGIEDMAKWMLWGVIIGIVVFLAVIIILILVLVRGDKQRAPQGYVPPTPPPYGMPQYRYAAPPAGPPILTASCPKCSARIDPQSDFCSKCGAKLK